MVLLVNSTSLRCPPAVSYYAKNKAVSESNSWHWALLSPLLAYRQHFISRNKVIIHWLRQLKHPAKPQLFSSSRSCLFCKPTASCLCLWWWELLLAGRGEKHWRNWEKKWVGDFLVRWHCQKALLNSRMPLPLWFIMGKCSYTLVLKD